MKAAQEIIPVVLKAVALAMGVVSIVLGLLNAGGASTQITLLAIGLFALALAALQKE
jgi:hypothetical protein